MPISKHILGSYNEALFALENDLLMMASLCERSLRDSWACLLARDSDLCGRIIANDDKIDQLEKRVDRSGIDLLRRFQPVAGDLRHVVTAMKLSGNLERIGDKAVNIARKAQELNSGPEMPEVNLLEPAYFEVTSMLNDVLRAYAESDIEIAIGIPLRDQKLDALNQEVTKALTFLMTKRPERIAGSLCLVFISRYLERAGDHIKEIAQDLVYAIAAEDIRHLGDRRPRSAADLLGTSSGDAGGTGGDEILAS